MAQFGFLPPGARGYLAGEQIEQEKQARGFAQLGALMQMQAALQKQAHEAQLQPLQLDLLRRQINAPQPLMNLGPGHVAVERGGNVVASNPAVERPFSNIHNVPGGFITNAPGFPFTRTQREPPEPVSERVVQDPQSPTGWSYEDARSLRRRPGAPPPAAAAKATDKDEALKRGKEQVSEIIGNLHAQYQDLSGKGGIADTTKSARHNLQTWIKSSTVGQAVGSALGTSEQSTRNQINMTRPLLMNAIRQATGQTARSLDSNVELQFYLQAATNPQRDIQSNLAALQKLDTLYGLGIGIEADPNAVAALEKQAPKRISPQSSQSPSAAPTVRIVDW